MKITTYKVICKNCKAKEVVDISEDNKILWGDPKHIISGRYRLDMQWGWQCADCGNYDIVSKQEKRDIRNLSSPDSSDLMKVLRAIEPQPPQFVMQEVK